MIKLERSILQEYKESLPHGQISSWSEYIKVKILLLWLALLNFLFPKGYIYRLENSIKFYFRLIDIDNDNLNQFQRPKAFFYLGLTSKSWYEPCEYEVLKFISDTLEKNAKCIENEWLGNRSYKRDLIVRAGPSDDHPSLKDDDWGEFILWTEGKFTQAACFLFPKTVKILSKIESFIFGDALFLVLKPGVSLPPHYDGFSTDITCQLGLIIPENCAIRVGSETRSWTEGKTLFFDNTFEHEVWNKSQKERVILLLDLYHPELTKIERLLLWICGDAFFK